MHYIVYKKGIPFSYEDFLEVEYDSKIYKFTHGTIRNIFSQLKKEGRIKLVYRSPQAFYSLSEVTFEKGMTPNYRGVLHKYNQAMLLKIFKVTNLDKPAIHDIRLLFHLKGLRNVILTNNNSNIIEDIDNKHNKDIKLKEIRQDDLIIRTTIHNTENVSVMIACSDNPIEIEDPISLSKLISGLTRVEERLQQEINHYLNSHLEKSVEIHRNTSISSHMNWVVKMWHFGQDSSHKYCGDLFDITLKEGLDIFHIYSKKKKKAKNITIIRSELPEYPNVSLKEAIKNKLNLLNA